MISPHTASGTLIVCINDTLNAFDIPELRHTYRKNDSLDGLCQGQVYTLAKIIP